MSFMTRILQSYSQKSSLINKVYQNLAFGLVAFAGTVMLLNKALPYSSLYKLSWLCLVANLLIPAMFSKRMFKLSEAAANAYFYLYAVSYGGMCASILGRYSLEQFAIGVGATSVLFLIAIYASKYLELKSSDSKLIGIGAITLLLASILNLFLRLTVIELGICCLGVAVTFGAIAYQIGTFEKWSVGMTDNRLAIIISLNLLSYVINMLIYILRFLSVTGIGNNRRD